MEKRMISLNDLIERYGEQNAECNALKKEVATLNSKLKETIKEYDKANEDIITDGWKCKLSITEDPVVNEPKLIQLAKDMNLDIVRTKEYIDFDALEKLIYTGSIPNDILLKIDECNEPKSKETLRVTKLKKKESENEEKD